MFNEHKSQSKRYIEKILFLVFKEYDAQRIMNNISNTWS